MDTDKNTQTKAKVYKYSKLSLILWALAVMPLSVLIGIGVSGFEEGYTLEFTATIYERSPDDNFCDYVPVDPEDDNDVPTEDTELQKQTFTYISVANEWLRDYMFPNSDDISSWEKDIIDKRNDDIELVNDLLSMFWVSAKDDSNLDNRIEISYYSKEEGEDGKYTSSCDYAEETIPLFVNPFRNADEFNFFKPTGLAWSVGGNTLNGYSNVGFIVFISLWIAGLVALITLMIVFARYSDVVITSSKSDNKEPKNPKKEKSIEGGDSNG